MVACILLGVLPHQRQGLHLIGGGLLLPGGQPFLIGRLGGPDLPGDGAAGLCLGAPRVLPGLLVQQPQRPPRRLLPAVRGLPLPGQLGQLRADRYGPRAEPGHHRLGDPADLAPVPVSPRHHHIAQVTQPFLREPVRHRRQAQLGTVQRPPVQRAVLVIGAIRALHPVPDRDVHVQVRVTVAGQVVQEQRRSQPPVLGAAGGVAPLPGNPGVVAGAGERGVLLQPAHRITCSIHQCTLDGICTGIQHRGPLGAPGGALPHSTDPVGGVQHRR